MSLRATSGRGRRFAAVRFLLLVALLPALVLGPAVDGAAVWIHSHEPSGAHVHVLPERLDHANLGATHGWHEGQHEYDHEGGLHEEESAEPKPSGLRIDLPALLAATRDGSSKSATSGLAFAALPASAWSLAHVALLHRFELCRSAWPPLRAKRSGVAALLRSSHAILI
jgi:hypothetical protein